MTLTSLRLDSLHREPYCLGGCRTLNTMVAELHIGGFYRLILAIGFLLFATAYIRERQTRPGPMFVVAGVVHTVALLCFVSLVVYALVEWLRHL